MVPPVWVGSSHPLVVRGAADPSADHPAAAGGWHHEAQVRHALSEAFSQFSEIRHNLCPVRNSPPI